MMYMAPWIVDESTLTFVLQPISYTSVARPANQVLLTELWTRSTCPTTTAWGSVQGQGYVTFGEAPPPDKKDYAAYGPVMPDWGNAWGKDGARNFAYATIPSLEEGKYTGGIAFRAMQKSSIVFADGHVQRLGPDKLADGTNWSLATKEMPTTQIHNLRNGRYMWHPDGL